MADATAKRTPAAGRLVGRVSGVLNWAALGGLIVVAASGNSGNPAAGSTENSARLAAVTIERRAAGIDQQAVIDGVRGRPDDNADTGALSKRGSRRVAVDGSESKPTEPAAQPAPAEKVEKLDQWSESEIAAARAECSAAMKGVTADWQVVPAMRSNACGAAAPILLRSVGGSRIELTPPATTNCRTAAALANWLEGHVQPAAEKLLGSRVTRIAIATSYDCRNRYGQKAAPLSEHALANALDVTGFRLADGRAVNLLSGWGKTARDMQMEQRQAMAAVSSDAAQKQGAADSKSPPGNERLEGRMQLGAGARGQASAKAVVPPGEKPKPATKEAEFLRGIHAGACTVFGTVLGPEANEAHRDHFHLDMKQRRRNSFCE